MASDHRFSFIKLHVNSMTLVGSTFGGGENELIRRDFLLAQRCQCHQRVWWKDGARVSDFRLRCHSNSHKWLAAMVKITITITITIFQFQNLNQFDNVRMIQSLHDLNFCLQVGLCIVLLAFERLKDFDSYHLFGERMSRLPHLAKPTRSKVLVKLKSKWNCCDR